MNFSRKNICHLGILAVFQMLILFGNYNVYGENTDDRNKFTIAIKGIRSAVDAYTIKLALSRLEGIEKVQFIIEDKRFRGCCSISEEYNNYIKNLKYLPMNVFTRGMPASKILNFLNRNFKEHTFEIVK